MGKLKEHFYQTAVKASDEIKQLIKEHGETVVDTVTLSQVYQGMRGIIGLVTETSLLDSNEGIRFRGFSIPELSKNYHTLREAHNLYPKDYFI